MSMTRLDHLIFEIEQGFRDCPEEDITICVGRIRTLIKVAQDQQKLIGVHNAWLSELRLENELLKEENKKIIRPRKSYFI